MKSGFGLLLLVLVGCIPWGSASLGDDSPIASGPDARFPEEKPEWAMNFADGSNNSFHLVQNASYPLGFLVFRPVQAMESSSGGYSGGEPWEAILPAGALLEIRERVERLASDTALHAASRMMGTGLFSFSQDEKKTRFILSSGSELTEFIGILKKFGP
jgi:hypothetical protein